MTSTVEFMGGPAHGTIRELAEDTPPPLYDVLPPPVPRLLTAPATPEPAVKLRTFRYRREVSALDDGPLWVYVPENWPAVQ